MREATKRVPLRDDPCPEVGKVFGGSRSDPRATLGGWSSLGDDSLEATGTIKGFASRLFAGVHDSLAMARHIHGTLIREPEPPTCHDDVKSNSAEPSLEELLRLSLNTMRELHGELDRIRQVIGE